MAGSDALADFAGMPPGRKLLVFALIGAVIGLGYWKLVYRSLDEQLAAAEAEHRRLAADVPKYEELRTHVARLRELIEKNQTALPSAPELPAFFETLDHKVRESGAEVAKWTKGNEEPVESFIRVPVDIQISGTFLQIKRFFASLVQRDVRPSPGTEERGTDERGTDEREPRERIVSIENLALTNPTRKDRDVILTARFTAVIFRQEDKPAAKPGGAAAPGARPAAPPASVAPPLPPLPSTATPAGAKAQAGVQAGARIEDALDKGSARNADAARAADGKAADGKAADGKAADGKAADGKAADGKAAGAARLKGGL